MPQSFVHLRLHTEFSLQDSIIRIKALTKKLVEQGASACAITDVNSFMGLIKFYKVLQAAGIKPICGCDFMLKPEEEGDSPALITLLAQNELGYRNITELISKSYLDGQHHGRPYLNVDWLSDHREGVIALSGGREGDIGQALCNDKQDRAEALLAKWQALYGDRFYCEIQRTGRQSEDRYLHRVVELATRLGVPVVATNDVRFLEQEQFEVHEARVCIGEGRTLDDPRREKRYSAQQYLRSSEEMWGLFDDIPEALENTVEIAQRCSFDLTLGKYFLPEYPIPEGMTEDQFFAKISREGLEERLAISLPASTENYQERKQAYIDRLDFEIKIICDMGFPGYFLIVMDFIQWAKRNDIPVGPGRGSGAGSLVAYSLKITDLDPLEYDLLFERFLNPERVSMPDFDVDFCMDNRDRVIAYVADTYGRNAVSQIITFGTMAAKAVVRDVARVQGKSYGLADKLSKMIPPDIGMTLEKAFEQESMIRDFLASDADAQEIWDMALHLEGLTRNVGKHAGGVVIAPTKLTDFSPLYCDEMGEGLVTQFDKNDVEDAGLVKFDFLGLRTLTIIDWAVKMINTQRQSKGEALLDINSIPLDDAPTFEMIKRAETTAVFQLESRGMKELIKRLAPDSLEDMIALVALFRPGPLQSGMVDDFINRKHGRAKVAYPDAKYQHESLKPILDPTYGVIVYQEQVMQIAQVLAGYTLGGADMLRRAMGKKKPEEMAKQRAVFESGAKEQGVDPTLAIKIFDLVEKFAGYGFNKSHSAAYALVSYQTAWLKAHYPAHFMAATMSSDMDKTDKVVTFVEESRAMGLEIIPPDVNRGHFQFVVDEQNRIVYGLGAIKGLGEGPVSAIIEARENTPFVDLFDFCARVDPKRVNKRALEALIKSGAFDTIGPGVDLDYDRAVFNVALTEAVKAAEQKLANDSAGMVDLFGDVVSSGSAEHDVYQDYQQVRRMNTRDRLNGERETLGLYLTGHPIDEYESELQQFVSTRIVDARPEKSRRTLAGLVVGFRLMKTKRGDSMAFVTLDDRSARIEVAVFSDAYEAHRDILVKDAILVVEGQISHDDFSGGLKMRADKVMDLASARLDRLQALRLHVNSERFASRDLHQLKHTLASHLGAGCHIEVCMRKAAQSAVWRLGDRWNVAPSDALLRQLQESFGTRSVELIRSGTAKS